MLKDRETGCQAVIGMRVNSHPLQHANVYKVPRYFTEEDYWNHSTFAAILPFQFVPFCDCVSSVLMLFNDARSNSKYIKKKAPHKCSLVLKLTGPREGSGPSPMPCVIPPPCTWPAPFKWNPGHLAAMVAVWPLTATRASFQPCSATHAVLLQLKCRTKICVTGKILWIWSSEMQLLMML